MSSNPDERTLERRLAAVERAVDGREQRSGDTQTADTGALENRLDELESRVDELDAALQAVRGFLGGVNAVNEGVESRANAAIAAVERLERRLDDVVEESKQYRHERQQRENPPSGEDPVKEWTSDAERGTTDWHPGERASESDEPTTGETAGAPDRSLRERLSERW